MKQSKFFICDYDHWISLNDPRITPITSEAFDVMFKSKCKKYNFNYPQLYKRLASTDPYCFISSEKMYECRLSWDSDKINPSNWKVLPDKRKSFTCFNYQEQEPGNLYIVVPFDCANFAICPESQLSKTIIEDSKDLIDQGFTRAYYNDPSKWLKGLTKRELWTDSSCILILQSVWETYFKK